MARTKNKHKTIRLPLALIEPAHKLLETLVSSGGYGNNPTEAAKIIIMAHLHALDERGKLDLFDQDSKDKSA